jgi:hypothetical protein
LSIQIHLADPILPVGARLTIEIGRGQVTSGLKDLKEAVAGIFVESDRSIGCTPTERALVDRLAQIEKAIISNLPAEVKLELANKAAN